MDVSLRDGKPLDRALETALGQLAGQHGLARLTWNGEVIATMTPPVQHFGRARVTPPPGAFLQATQDGEAALLATVLEGGIGGGAKSVVDLFAGSGTFSLPVADHADVHAVEGGIEAMTSALDAGWRHTPGGLHRVTTETRDLFRRPPLLPDELNRFDAAIIDPPRAGGPKRRWSRLRQAIWPASPWSRATRSPLPVTQKS